MLEAKLNDPEAPDFEEAVERFGEVAGALSRSSAATTSRRAPTRSSPASASSRSRSRATSARSPAAGRCASRSRRSSARSPTRCSSTSPPTTSTSSRSSGSRASCATIAARSLMTCHDRDVMNRVVKKIVEIDGGEVSRATPATTTSTSSSARLAAAQQASAVRAPAGDAREGGGLHRALQGPREPRRAGPEPREEAREDREGRAAAAHRREDLRLQPRAAPATTSSRSRGSRRRTATQGLRRARSPRAAHASAGRHGRERRRQDDAAQDDGRRARSPTPATSRSAPRCRWATSPSTRWSSSPATHGHRGAPAARRTRTSARCAPRRRVRLPRRRPRQALRVLSGGEKARASRWRRSSSTRRTCSSSTSRPTISTS